MYGAWRTHSPMKLVATAPFTKSTIPDDSKILVNFAIKKHVFQSGFLDFFCGFLFFLGLEGFVFHNLSQNFGQPFHANISPMLFEEKRNASRITLSHQIPMPR